MLKLSPKMWYLLKYGLLVIIATGVFLSVLPKQQSKQPEYVPDTLDLFDENGTDSNLNEIFTLATLRDDVTHCLTKFTRDGVNKEYFEKRKTNKSKFKTDTKDKPFDSTIFTVLTSFNNLLSLLDVQAVVIEPSVLYCMLRPRYQELLLKRKFRIPDISKPKSILTYGILKQDVVTLQNEEAMLRFSEINFQSYFLQAPLADWMKTQQYEFAKFPSHIFYEHKLFTVHVVVFHKRNGYYWHASLAEVPSQIIQSKDELLFVDHNSAYEKFEFVSLENKVPPVAEFYVPSNTHYFLFEMRTSKFLECTFSKPTYSFFTRLPDTHPKMSVERFNKRTRIILRELKTIFHPLLMSLWLWSGTLLGWYRQCDIIPYTTDVDFAAWASEVENVTEIVNLLLNNKHVTMLYRMGVLEEALELQLKCHGLRADVFFGYRIVNGTWYSGHSPKLGYYFRYFQPHFTLCSAELLGEKVQVPCETEKVIEADYGSGWKKPVPSWDYESSSKNRGPNIYWEENMRQKALQVF